MNIFRDIHQKHVPTAKVSKMRKMPKIHLNDLVCSSFEREFNGEHFILAQDYTFSGEKWQKNQFEICRKKNSQEPPLWVRSPASMQGRSYGQLTEGGGPGARAWLSQPAWADGGPHSRFFQSPIETIKVEQNDKLTVHSIENFILNNFSPVHFFD